MSTENKNRRIIPAKMVARAADASEHTVKKVRAKKREKGAVAERVMKADEMLHERLNGLVEEVRRVVKV